MVNPKIRPLIVRLVGSDCLRDAARADVFSSINFKAKYKQYFLDPASSELFVGIDFSPTEKSIDPYYRVDYYEVGAGIARRLAKTKFSELTINNESTYTPTADELNQLILGIHQSGWQFDKYLSKQKYRARQYNISLGDGFAGVAMDDEYVTALYEAVTMVRGLVDEIPERLNPRTIEQIVTKKLSTKPSVKLHMLKLADISKLGMEGVEFVARGSQYDPLLVHAVLKPSGPLKRRICLVGKGITYDSGGLDVKIGGHMKTMKMDMAGAATMFGTLLALSDLGLVETEVHWISAFAENMISGNSYKADDIITTYSGQTVEVMNTDAEGRLTLADALCYATLQDPDYIVDAATLTGAAVVAASEYYTPIMCNDAELSDQLRSSFESEQERVMMTPLPEVLRPMVAGKISDLINTSTLDRQAGHITAGLFLSNFVDQKHFRNPKLGIKNPKQYAWAHLDIAGTAYNNGKNSLVADGATGHGVRSLVRWVRDLDKQK
jgi:leucyl aminopeptidase